MAKIIIVSALWCPSCLILNKQIKKIKELYPDLIIDKLDYDFDEDKIKKYNVGEILPVIINEAHQDVRLIGEKSDQELQDFIESVIKGC